MPTFVYYIIVLIVSLYGVSILSNFLRGHVSFMKFVITELVASGILLYVWKHVQ